MVTKSDGLSRAPDRIRKRNQLSPYVNLTYAFPLSIRNKTGSLCALDLCTLDLIELIKSERVTGQQMPGEVFAALVQIC
jgi:hypothetical protein